MICIVFNFGGEVHKSVSRSRPWQQFGSRKRLLPVWIVWDLRLALEIRQAFRSAVSTWGTLLSLVQLVIQEPPCTSWGYSNLSADLLHRDSPVLGHQIVHLFHNAFVGCCYWAATPGCIFDAWIVVAKLGSPSFDNRMAWCFSPKFLNKWWLTLEMTAIVDGVRRKLH